jgi:hypothetical protein
MNKNDRDDTGNMWVQELPPNERQARRVANDYR